MNFKIKIFIFFSFIFLILFYPIFNFSKSKITKINTNVTEVSFKTTFFFKINMIQSLLTKAEKEVFNINQEFFGGKQVLKMSPDKLFSLNIIKDFEKVTLFLGDKNIVLQKNKNNEEVFETFNLPILRYYTNDFIIYLNNKKKNYITFSIPFDQILNLNRDHLGLKNFNDSSDCNNFKNFSPISFKKIYLFNIEYYFETKLVGVTEKDKINEVVERCFSKLLDNYSKKIIKYIDFHNQESHNQFYKNLEIFIEEENFFSENEIEISNFRERIGNLNSQLIEITKSINYNVKFFPLENILITDTYSRNYNLLGIVIIGNLIVSIILMYFLYFVRNHLSFLKKIFK